MWKIMDALGMALLELSNFIKLIIYLATGVLLLSPSIPFLIIIYVLIGGVSFEKKEDNR